MAGTEHNMWQYTVFPGGAIAVNHWQGRDISQILS